MPVLSFEVGPVSDKPLVDLYVMMGATDRESRREDGLPVPGALLVTALVDSGADRSHVDLDVLERLGLSSVGDVELFTASTGGVSITMSLYAVDLSFAGDNPGPFVEDLKVIGSIFLDGLKVQMLLGRDILDNCLLVYDGPHRRFTLAYDAPESRPED
jgi:hypothetical protein